MIKRLWLAISIPWAALCLYGGTTRATGIAEKDVIMAFFPLITGLVLGRVGRWVLKG